MIFIPQDAGRAAAKRAARAASAVPLAVRSLSVTYERAPALWDVDFTAAASKLTAIVGPNGAGKSTFIKACLGLVPSVSGRVRFWGQPYARVRNRVGYVPQRESVDWDFPVSALDVVLMGRYRRIGFGRPITRRHRQAALEHLDRVGLAGQAKRQISQLSGGQQQRVFLARALAQEADLYLMDEPFAGVDAATERAILEVLRTLRSEGKTVLVVHHDLHTVAEYFDEVLLLNMRVVASGAVDAVLDSDRLAQTYGQRMALVSQVAEAVARRHEP